MVQLKRSTVWHQVNRYEGMPLIVCFSCAGSDAHVISITHAERATFLEVIASDIAARRGFSVATLNMDHLVKLRHDDAFRAAYLAQSYVVADGRPIAWLARLAGRRIDVVPGSELVEPLCVLAAGAGVSVAIVGSTEEVLAKAAQRLEAAHSGLRVVTRIAPPFGFDPEEPDVAEIADQLNQDDAGLCFLALGAPKQERLAMRLQEAVPRCGFVSVGAGIDFIAGHQARAPLWVRKIAMEWLWRLLGNPARLAGRYAACFAILPGLALQALNEGRSKRV